MGVNSAVNIFSWSWLGEESHECSLVIYIIQVHEIANDIKKAWKGMKDSQDWGRVLNQRQKLFGQPVVPFADLNRLVKEFEPYRNLWVTASGMTFFIILIRKMFSLLIGPRSSHLSFFHMFYDRFFTRLLIVSNISSRYS